MILLIILSVTGIVTQRTNLGSRRSESSAAEMDTKLNDGQPIVSAVHVQICGTMNMK